METEQTREEYVESASQAITSFVPFLDYDVFNERLMAIACAYELEADRTYGQFCDEFVFDDYISSRPDLFEDSELMKSARCIAPDEIFQLARGVQLSVIAHVDLYFRMKLVKELTRQTKEGLGSSMLVHKLLLDGGKGDNINKYEVETDVDYILRERKQTFEEIGPLLSELAVKIFNAYINSSFKP